MSSSPTHGKTVAFPATAGMTAFRSEFSALDHAFSLDGASGGLEAMDREELMYLAAKLVAAGRRVISADATERSASRAASPRGSRNGSPRASPRSRSPQVRIIQLGTLTPSMSGLSPLASPQALTPKTLQQSAQAITPREAGERVSDWQGDIDAEASGGSNTWNGLTYD